MGDITIKFKENSSSCTIEYEKQLRNRSIKSSKNVSIEDFVALFQKIEVPTSMILPKSCVGWRTTSDRVYYYLDFPAQIKTVVVKNKSGKVCFYDKIPIPRTLFVVGLNKDNPSLNNISTQIYALKGIESFNFNTTKYCMPMLNVFSDNRICWGTNKLRLGNNASDLSSLDSLYDAFWDSNFNFDLNPHYIVEAALVLMRNKGINSSALRFEDLLRALHLCDSFPEDLLERAN